MANEKSIIPEGRPLRAEDLNDENTEAARQTWAAQGNVRSHLPDVIADATKSNRANPSAQKKNARRKEIAEDLLKRSDVQDKPITMSGAVNNRVSLFQQAVEHARHHGLAVPQGTGWYWDHAKAIEDAGRQFGFDRETAIRATTPLSAQNNPETERRGGAALMDLVANQHKYTVELTPELHKAVSEKATSKGWGGTALPDSMKGKTVSASDLSSKQLTALASVSKDHEEKHGKINTDIDVAGMRSVRGPGPAAKSIEFLRGERSAKDLVNPLTAPKIASYTERTLSAHYDDPAYGEYMLRLHHYTHGNPNQGVLDLYGLRHSDEGMLSSKADTAEDSWMQAISTGQPLESTDGVSPAKFAASDSKLADPGSAHKRSPVTGKTAHPSGQVSGAAIIHSQNNLATRTAAAQNPVQMGGETANLPATAMQEVPWMQARIIADKADELKKPVEQPQLFRDRRSKNTNDPTESNNNPTTYQQQSLF